VGVSTVVVSGSGATTEAWGASDGMRLKDDEVLGADAHPTVPTATASTAVTARACMFHLRATSHGVGDAPTD